MSVGRAGGLSAGWGTSWDRSSGAQLHKQGGSGRPEQRCYKCTWPAVAVKRPSLGVFRFMLGAVARYWRHAGAAWGTAISRCTSDDTSGRTVQRMVY